MDAFAEAHDIVIDLVVCLVEFLEHDDVLITLLLCFSQGFS